MIRSLTSHALSPCNQTAYWKQMVLHNCKICSSLWLHYDENMRVLLFAAWQCTTPIYYNYYCCCCCCCSFFAGVSTELENATMESRSKSQNRRLILARATFFLSLCSPCRKPHAHHDLPLQGRFILIPRKQQTNSHVNAKRTAKFSHI